MNFFSFRAISFITLKKEQFYKSWGDSCTKVLLGFDGINHFTCVNLIWWKRQNFPSSCCVCVQGSNSVLQKTVSHTHAWIGNAGCVVFPLYKFLVEGEEDWCYVNSIFPYSSKQCNWSSVSSLLSAFVHWLGTIFYFILILIIFQEKKYAKSHLPFLTKVLIGALLPVV